MEVTPKVLFTAMGLGDPVPGQHKLPSPATLLEKKTGETVEVVSVFYDDRDVNQSMVLLAEPKERPGWRPLEHFRLPPVVEKYLEPRLVRSQAQSAGA